MTTSSEPFERTKRKGKWQEIVTKFAQSGKPHASVKVEEDEDMESLRISLLRATRSTALAEVVGVTTAGGRLKLFRRDEMEV